VTCRDEGMEQVLWDVFKVLTPRSAFLSRHMAELLHQVQLGEITVAALNDEFDELREAAKHDQKQQILIAQARTLVQ